MILLLWLACSGDKDSAADSAGGDTLEPTLTNVQAEVFDKSCAFSSCHSGSGAGGLSLDPGASYGELVGVDSTGSPGNPLVVEGDADASYLIWKLEDRDTVTGDEMPPGAPVSELQKGLVEAWIAAGAKDN